VLAHCASGQALSRPTHFASGRVVGLNRQRPPTKRQFWLRLALGKRRMPAFVDGACLRLWLYVNAREHLNHDHLTRGSWFKYLAYPCVALVPAQPAVCWLSSLVRRSSGTSG
jgi:hypothetical protein